MKLYRLFLAMVISIGVPLIAGENLIKNGSFEDFTVKEDKGDYRIVDLSSWQGSDAKVWDSDQEKSATDGDYKIELDGSSGVDKFYQDVDFEVGKIYEISLDAYAREVGTSKFYIQLDNVKILRVEPTSDWKRYSVRFKATKSTHNIKLRESSTQNDGVGAVVDNITIYEVSFDEDDTILKNGSFEDFTVKEDKGDYRIVNLISWQGSDAKVWDSDQEKSATDGDYKIELDGSSGVDKFYQDVNLEVGETYEISLDAYAREVGTSKFYIQLDNVKILKVEPTSDWKRYSVEFKATKSTHNIKLRESSTQNDKIGAVVDNITIKKISSSEDEDTESIETPTPTPTATPTPTPTPILPEDDKTPPIISLNGRSNIILSLGEEYREAGFSATDNLDGNITNQVVVTNNIDSSKEGVYEIIYSVTDSAGNKTQIKREVKVVYFPLDYIPKDENLTYEVVFRFLQKTTFGPTEELIEEVQKKGIVPWLNEQLNQTYELNDSLVYQTLRMGKIINPFAYHHEIEEYMAEDSTHFLPPWGSDHLKVRDYFLSSWFKDVFWNKKQVQLRVAYALSQIIVASDSAGIFREKYQALAGYYDLMKKHAFGNYGDLLKEVSTNPAMGYYLTFYGNQKKHLNNRGEWVYPDENYAREVMQLFSISPFLLHMDGTKVLDSSGEPIPSYTQDDVNELARVFTGFDFRRASNFGNTGRRGGDLLHKMECHNEYHDTEEKSVLNNTIPAGGDCYEDVEKAMDILMSHQNTAPFIAKKLIMRLAKSNPSPDYVRRVAEVFENNGLGEKGDIKETVRAIYLDKEFWDDIINNKSMKYKEPIIAFTQMARAFHVKPYPKWHLKISSPDTKDIRDKEVVLEDTGLIWIDNPSGYFGQGPTQSNTVFNFYSDEYVPSDSYFLNNNYVAPEIQIQTDGELVAYHNYIYNVLLNEKNYALNRHGVNLYNPYRFKVYNDMKEFGNDLDMIFHPDKFYFDMTPYYKLVEDTLREEIDGADLEEILDKAHDQKYLFSLELRKKAISKVVDLLDKELAGNGLNDEFKQLLVDKYAIKLRYWDSRDQRLFYMLVLKMLVQMVVIYDDYKVE